MLRHLREPVKILAGGELSRPLNVHAHKFSAAARARIEDAGGTATLIGDDAGETESEPAAEDAAEE